MPTLALSIAQAETDKRAYLDNVKLWYTPVCDISARAENGKAVVTLAPNQLKADSASIIAASFDANGGLLDISETAIKDMTEGARDITVEKAEGAASMRIYIWKGDTSNPKPLTDAPLTVSFN